MNERITVLGVGSEAVDVIQRMIDEKVSGVDFAFTGVRGYIADDWTNGLLTFFHIDDVGDCEKIVCEKFSDTDMLIIISDSIEKYEVFLASEISRHARAVGILTVGIIFLDYNTLRFDCPGFSEHFNKFYDTAFLHFDTDCERLFLYAKRVIECISSFITKSGYINLEFSDIKDFLGVKGYATFRKGYFGGYNKCRNAAIEAIYSGMKEADRILVNITSDPEITLTEMMDAVSMIQEAAPKAQVIWGHVIDESLNDCVRLSLIAKEDLHS